MKNATAVGATLSYLDRVRLVLVIATAWAAFPSAAAASGCPPRLDWQGAAYYGASAPRPVETGALLGTGLRPACAGFPSTPQRDVPVHRIPGISARVAVAVGGDANTHWPAAGFFPQHRSHPLFGEVRIVRPGGLRCGRRVVVWEDEVPLTPSVYEPLRLRRGFAEVRVGTGTRFTGRRLAGLPYAERGDRVRVRGRRCVRTDHRVRVIRPLSVRILRRR